MQFLYIMNLYQFRNIAHALQATGPSLASDTLPRRIVVQHLMFCGEAKRSRRTLSLCKQEGRHVTSRRLLRATTHPLARSIVSSIKPSVSFSPTRRSQDNGSMTRVQVQRHHAPGGSHPPVASAPRTCTRVFDREALRASARHAG
jgi:hypothetical protein